MRKNIIFLVIALLGIASFSKADNVSIDDFTIKQGETIQVPLKLTNTNTNLTAFSMTLTLPKGLKLIGGEATSRFAGDIEVGSPDPSANMYNVCGIHLGSGVISGSSGDLVLLTFEASQDFMGGNATITEVDFVTSDRKHVRLSDTSFRVDYEQSGSVRMGDVDDNGIVDISDVMSTVNKMLGKKVSPFNFANADTDGNGDIDIVDVMNVVNIMLGKKIS